MTLESPSTTSPRRFRMAGALAASLAIVLAAGIGAAPASAQTLEQSAATVPYVRVQLQTHWTPRGANVRSIRIHGLPGFPDSTFNQCYSMGAYVPGIDAWPYIKVDVPQGPYKITSYTGPWCGEAFKTKRGVGLMYTDYRNWMVSSDDQPTPRG
ncbi:MULTISPECIES: hypothetical protein [Clavibacter]|uniref:Secreted protein n=1 Tax=Clavibacter tessellarius TaxID=31965 RepID=A0A154UYL9_9MICO|nr:MULTISPECIES: hypothetical protein [Clavibacter]KZC94054.1 hypothetical protein AWH51_15250 [Clavibacter michiganensis subsp. tessellarius]MBT1636369.1 hypothetical protein [Clavibacter michiganensis]MDA3803676.1 hypothetical protein [Clavibacter sp. CT19]